MTFSTVLFFSRSRALVEPLDWFSRFMTQMRCFRAKRALFRVRRTGSVVWRKYFSKSSRSGHEYALASEKKRKNRKIAISPKL